MTFKSLREASGMTQKAFAEYFNIPKRTIEDWEAEKRKCPEYLLSLMAYKLKKEGFIPFGYNADGTICAEEADVVKRHVEYLTAQACEPLIDKETFEKARSALLKSNPALVESVERDLQKSNEERWKIINATSYFGNLSPEELSKRTKEFGKHRKSEKTGE